MKKNKMSIETLIEYIGYGLVFGIVIFWNFFSNLFNIELEKAILILIGLVAASNIVWTRNFHQIESKLKDIQTAEVYSCDDLQSAFQEVVNRNANIKHLRIYSISTGVINPTIRAMLGKITIEKCTIMMREFSENDPLKNDAFDRELNQLIQRWRNLERDGIIKNLEIVRYDFLPTEYQCIFDDDSVVIGIYHPDDSDDSHVGVKAKPLIITKDVPQGKEIVKTYIDRFDFMVNFYKQKKLKNKVC